eukprot:TRINITY_DN15386_c0_g1_i1.p3 TRINITY_DN15386_c0_g1~~TRINITY_DN15386_c0_g1_i1.p3  ORF type:complete len:64 (+),score=14.39 TRINITY_DN15386_c0_g1_i1:248-439(+)
MYDLSQHVLHDHGQQFCIAEGADCEDEEYFTVAPEEGCGEGVLAATCMMHSEFCDVNTQRNST